MNRSSKGKKRSGLATVELAVVMPILLTLTLATIDVCSAIFVKESLTIAAYEGARVGAMRGATNNDVANRIRSFLDERGIVYNSSSVVSISAPGFNGANTLEHVTVTVTVPCANNLVAPKQVFGNRNLQSSVTVRKQFRNLN